MTVVLAILIFGALVFVHEFGHFSTARLFGVTVREFAIGMGPTILKFEGKPDAEGNRTKYALRLLPIGGFVSMDGEDEASANANAFCNKPIWQRFIIVAAGGITNLITGVLCMIILVCSMRTFGGTTIGYSKNATEPPATALVDGDRILSVGDKTVHIDYDLFYAIMREGTEPVDIVVERDGEIITLENVVFPTETTGGITIGTIDFGVYPEERTFGTIVKQSYWRSVTSVRMIWDSILDLVTGKIGMEAMSGPVGVAGAISDAASSGARTVLSLVSLISLNLGIMNLLPIPALDGGRLVFLLVELVRRKPLKPEVEGTINFVGLALLMLLILFVTFQDIGRLI